MNMFLILPLVAVGYLTSVTWALSSWKPIARGADRVIDSTGSNRHLFANSLAGAPEMAVEISTPQNESIDPRDAVKPGMTENDKFVCDSSVEFWQKFYEESDERYLQRIPEILTKHQTTPIGRAYWMSHVLRTSYFFSNAVAGLLARNVNDFLIAPGNANQFAKPFPFAQNHVGGRILAETFLAYEQDWKHVEKGLLAFPWDALLRQEKNQERIRLQFDHRQFNPFFVLGETSSVVDESVAILGRRNRLGGKPFGVWLRSGTENHLPKNSTTFGNFDYPSYYLNDFHYQTDGWMSSQSANLYEVSTETLFLGRQDAMQRQTLLPLKKYFSSMAKGEPESILEVACGTGRFATFTRDNFPQAHLTLTDLSPFYLEKARANEAYWRSYHNFDEGVPPVDFIQANAEKLPFEDESFDAVTCVYLFHELPNQARQRVAAEMARVVKRRGIVILTDACQLGDRPPLDSQLPGFSRFNEPHFMDYIATDLSSLFEEHGLTCHEKYIVSSTKTLSFIKK